MKELEFVESETSKFKKASGCELHCVVNPDPNTAKVNLMLLENGGTH